MRSCPIELGIFLPITDHGWVISTTAPQFAPSYDMNKRLALRCEEFGFDFAFSMVKWRGFGGEMGYWDQALEPMTLMASLAAVTTRMDLIASVQPLTFHPAVMARMAMTIDNVSGGRFGINIVGGASKLEYEQMGLWPSDEYYTTRYDHLDEWMEVVKELWTSGRSNHKGPYFRLEDCQMMPAPVRVPHPRIVSAGMSDRGLEFAATHSDVAFVNGVDDAETRAASERVREMAAVRHRQIQCFAGCPIICEPTDELAQARVRRYEEGAAWDTLARIGLAGKTDTGPRGKWGVLDQTMKTWPVFWGVPPLFGSPQTVAERLADIVESCALDGMMFTFCDWDYDLDMFGREVMPLLRQYGLIGKKGDSPEGC